MSKGQPATQSGRRVLGRCKNKRIMENVEIIDVESKTDVVIIDKPETSHQGSRSFRTKTRTSCPKDIIHIDDEEGDANGIHSNACYNSTNKTLEPVGGTSPFSGDSDDSEFLIFSRGDYSSSKSYAKDRMQTGCDTFRNRYGLDSFSENTTSESDSSEFYTSGSDSSDCEIIEDSGSIREQWERAAFRKKVSHNVQLGSENPASASGSSADSGFTSEENAKDMEDVQYCMNTINKSCSKNLGEEYGGSEPSSSGNGDNFSCQMTDPNDPIFDSFLDKRKNAANFNPSADMNYKYSGFWKNEKQNPEKCSPSAQFDRYSHINHNGTCFPDFTMQEGINFRDCGFTCTEKDEQVPAKTSFSMDELRGQNNSHDKEEPCPGKSSEAWSRGCLFPDDACFCNKKDYSSPAKDPALDHETAARMKENSLVVPMGHQLADESQLKVRNCFFSPFKEATIVEPTGNTNSGEETTQIRPQAISRAQSDLVGDLGNNKEASIDVNEHELQDDLIGEREKHKESAEYKLAEEEEWASRQRELQIQAEEAQRLRRRRKAENLRMLDTERRQKQRLEEIRQSQKKDEEIINMKEHIRAEVRKELEDMEARHRDMASLLRELGIHVKGGPFPLAREVNAAYKQALLRFHPDRASRTDIRGQVEAEETFKLISRLREKLMPVT